MSSHITPQMALDAHYYLQQAANQALLAHAVKDSSIHYRHKMTEMLEMAAAKLGCKIIQIEGVSPMSS
jgi:hypothetical protein